jgi:hypothetical protein
MQREIFPRPTADMGADFEFLLPEEDIYFFLKSIVSAHKHQHPGKRSTPIASSGATNPSWFVLILSTVKIWTPT